MFETFCQAFILVGNLNIPETDSDNPQYIKASVIPELIINQPSKKSHFCPLSYVHISMVKSLLKSHLNFTFFSIDGRQKGIKTPGEPWLKPWSILTKIVFLVIPSIIIGSKNNGYYKSHPEPLKMAIEIVDFPIKDGDPIIMVIIFIPS